MSSAKKATLYIDIDDEITTIIDKVVSSKEKIVAIVLPKRATVLQSVVNMKLLKRSADEASKKIVLITSDSGVVPLAGIAGVHIAKTLQSKPEVPKPPKIEEAQDVEDEIAEDVELDKTKTLAALSGDEEETAEVPEITEKSSKKLKKQDGKKNKKLKIPNFSKFRLKLALGVALLIFLIGGWVAAAKVLPKANIVVKTDTKSFSKDLQLTATIAEAEDSLQAKTELLEKSDSQTVPATGERNVGEKAEGTMTLTNCIDDDDDHTVPKGSTFSKDGKTFVTTKAVTLKESIYLSGECATGEFGGYGGQKDVEVVAADGGTSFNIGEGAYNSSIAGINAYGSDMKGGTDNIKKVVSQGDIDQATQQLKAKTSEGTVDELKAQLVSQGYIPFESTFVAEEPVITSSENANAEASAVTVTGTAKFQMVGVNKQDIEDAIKEASKEDIDDSAQAISDTGIDNATLRISEASPGVYSLSVDTLVTAGPQLSPDVLKQEVIGKKYGDTESTLSSKAGVVDVDIEYSPFWVNATPKDQSKVTITIENISEDE